MKPYSRQFLMRLYRDMVKIRLCEESLIQPIIAHEIRGPVHLCSGQEAIAVGVCAALRKEDYVFGNHRSHGHYLAKGGDLGRLIAEIFGKETGCSRGRGGSMHLCDPGHGFLGSAPIVAGTISLALGAALASSIRQDDRVTVSFFGDGAAGEGVLYESLNFAALRKLPIVFVCENNLYSTHLPILECRPSIDIYQAGHACSVSSSKGDGNDVVAVYEAAQEAVGFCRKKRGPVFIEFKTYRLRGHVGADDNIQGVHTDIRPKKEIAAWVKKDPIRAFERVLLKKHIVRKEDLQKIDDAAEREVDSAYRFMRRSPYPRPEDLTKYVYTD